MSSTLGVPVTEFALLRDFAPADVATLADAVDRALRVQRDEIDASLESALSFIPRPLRGRARKLLFPQAGERG
jgi:hypothetical protein